MNKLSSKLQSMYLHVVINTRVRCTNVTRVPSHEITFLVMIMHLPNFELHTIVKNQVTCIRLIRKCTIIAADYSVL